MKNRELARGGMLTAVGLVLLLAAGASFSMSVALCILAGVCTAMPLLRENKMRTAVLIYVATAVLAAILVPRKAPVALYIAVCGLYPILKFVIESRLSPYAQRICKNGFAVLICLAAYAAVRAGLLPDIKTPGLFRLIVGLVVGDLVFQVYDLGLSRLIALLRHRLPPL